MFSRQQKMVRLPRPVIGVWKRAVLAASLKPEMYTHVYAVWWCPRNQLIRRLRKLFRCLSSVSPEACEVYETYWFHARLQSSDGKASEFLADLRSIADHRTFGTALERNLRDRFMIGFREKTAQRMLPAKPNKSKLQGPLGIAQAAALAMQGASHLPGSRTSTLLEVNAMGFTKRKEYHM